MLMVGLSLHNAWVCSALYSTGAPGGTITLPGMRGGTFSLVYLISIVGFAVTSLLAVRFDRSLTRFSRSRPAMGVAAGVTCAGTLVSLMSLDNLVLDVCAGMLTGLGSATLMLYWGTALSRTDEQVIALASPVGVVVGFAVNALVLETLPRPTGEVMTAALPLLELALLNAISPREGQDAPFLFNELAVGKAKFGFALLEMTALAGLVLGMLKQTAIQTTFGGTTTPTTLVILLVAGSMAIAAFVIYALVGNGSAPDQLFKNVIPALGCASLVAAMLVAEYEVLFDLFLVVTYFLYETVLWSYGAFLSNRLRLSPIFVFGLTRGLSTLAMLLGIVAMSQLSPLLAASPLGTRVMLFIALVLILLSRSAQPDESAVMRSIVRCPAVRLFSVGIDDRIALLGRRKPTGTRHEPETGATKAAPTATSPLRHDVSPVSQPSQPSASTPSASVTAPLDHPSLGGASTNASATREGKFSRKVRKVAQIYLLTERETDILFEWVKGNGAPYIQEKYSISEGTVKTHVRNIYRKLDIHKRRDLLQLIESIDDYD